MMLNFHLGATIEEVEQCRDILYEAMNWAVSQAIERDCSQKVIDLLGQLSNEFYVDAIYTDEGYYRLIPHDPRD